MSQANADKIHYLRIPKGQGARAEMVRMAYVLAGRPYVDVLCTPAEAARTVAGKNPFKQFPFVETPSGALIYQTLAIMHHAGRGTPVWPDDPGGLSNALSVAMGAYDLYQAFAGFSADDTVAKKRFEERRAPQYLGGLGEIYAARDFASGDAPTFADCIVHEAVAWCVRRNDVSRQLLEGNRALLAFQARFEALPAMHDFMSRQGAARRIDDSV